MTDEDNDDEFGFYWTPEEKTENPEGLRFELMRQIDGRKVTFYESDLFDIPSAAPCGFLIAVHIDGTRLYCIDFALYSNYHGPFWTEADSASDAIDDLYDDVIAELNVI